MRYFHVQFAYNYYSWPHLHNRLSEKALEVADKEVEQVLSTISKNMKNFNYRHSYGWPDGSLYKFIAADETQSFIELVLHGVFNQDIILKIDVQEIPADYKVTKVGANTVKELFDG